MESFQQQALGFNVPNSDFNPNSVPTNGEQYLQKVFYERAKCPAVVVKPLTSVESVSTKLTHAIIWTQYSSVRHKAISTISPTLNAHLFAGRN